MFEATIGIVKAMFSAKGIDPKIRETIILRAAKVLNAYDAQANVAMAKTQACLPRRSTLSPPMARYPVLIRSMFSCAKRPMSYQRAVYCAMRPCANF
jgi:hypothetical protein